MATCHPQKLTGIVGTVPYLAPEIINGNDYTNKVDVWSLGVILYYMIYNKLPYDA